MLKADIASDDRHTDLAANTEKCYSSIDLTEERPPLEHAISAVSNHDMPAVVNTPSRGQDEIYNKFPAHRKRIIAAVVSFCGFLAPISSTTVLSAVPEVAATYRCDGAIINLSNAMYLVFMGVSPMFWGPIGNVYGRRWVEFGPPLEAFSWSRLSFADSNAIQASIISATLFFAFSVGTAVSPNLAAFFIFRMLTAFQGTSFLIIGSSAIGDIYKPTERGTAMGWFLSGTLIGPALGPFIGGIIVTFKSWRVIFWLQAALGGFGALLVIFLFPETIRYKRSEDLKGLPAQRKAYIMWQWLNPFRIIRLYRYPNLLTVALASSSLVWNMYSLLTPIRYVLNPRFDLTSPIQSGLFYIAPGCGYLLGTFFGGRWADHIVKKWIKIRGERVSEDRLRSCLGFIGAVIPGCILIYGWSIEKRRGGIPLPVVMMFLQGVAQLFCFPCLNTYCLDVMQTRSAEVVAGNYMFRYLFGALGTAVCLPAIRKIGVGWFSTISAGFLVIATFATYVTTVKGRDWREKMDKRKKMRKDREAQIEEVELN